MVASDFCLCGGLIYLQTADPSYQGYCQSCGKVFTFTDELRVVSGVGGGGDQQEAPRQRGTTPETQS